MTSSREEKKEQLKSKLYEKVEELNKESVEDIANSKAIQLIALFLYQMSHKADPEGELPLGFYFRARQIVGGLKREGIHMVEEIKEAVEDPYSEVTWAVPGTRHGQVSVRGSDGLITSTGVATPYDSPEEALGHARALLTAHNFVTEVM